MREPVTSTASMATVPSFFSAGLAAAGLGTVTGVWANETPALTARAIANASGTETGRVFMVR